MVDAAVLLQQINSEPLSSILNQCRAPTPLPEPFSILFRNLAPPPIIEINAPSHMGKSHLLYFAVAQIILPRFKDGLRSIPAQTVIFIDCNKQFDIHRLHKIVRKYAKDQITERRQGGFSTPFSMRSHSDEEIDQLVQNALTNLHLFQPASPMALLATVKSIPNFISQHGHGSFGMLCIDSLTAFHHIMRAKEKITGYYAQLSSSLVDISRIFSIPIIVTSWSLFPVAPMTSEHRPLIGVPASYPHGVSPHRPAWRQYFPTEWSQRATKRVILHKHEARGFARGIGLEDAEKEREKREVVRRGRVLGWLENDEKREFEMFITEEGVQIVY
jgi:hypothetical protein